MSILVEDTSRNNLASWVSTAVTNGLVDGAVLSPFATPAESTNFKSSGGTTAASLAADGGSVWFDAATHALAMPSVGDFRYYDGWNLWGGARGDLLGGGQQRDHVLRVLSQQDSIGAVPLGPTTLLTSASGAEPALAYSLAELTLEARDDAWITVAGTATFWTSGHDLDAYVGALAQTGAEGYVLVVARPTADMPVSASQDEVFGVCRTTRSLSEHGAVHVSHGDFAGLPAVAAGADSLGTGWDLRQRVCSFTSYEARDPSATFGSWFQRPTYGGLLACITRAAAERLENQDRPLSERLHSGPLHPDGPKEAFTHHVEVLSNLVAQMASLAYADRFRFLDQVYGNAAAEWPNAVAAGNVETTETRWIGRLHAGLTAYGESEGWI